MCPRKTFETNIMNIYGNRGKDWLNALPQLMSRIAAEYGLSGLNPVSNLSYNYVLSGFQDALPIILKLSLDIDGLKREAAALNAFTGFGAIKVIAQQSGALLLERAIPGSSLKTSLLSKDDDAINIACRVMQNLHQAPFPKESFLHIKDRLQPLDKNWDIPIHYLEKARKLRDKLLTTSAKVVLLHGDLHRENILQSGADWVVIDPKGVIGYPINDVWTFIENIEKDTQIIADFFSFDLQDIRDWYFVHLILAVCWSQEDNIDCKQFLMLATEAYQWVSK